MDREKLVQGQIASGNIFSFFTVFFVYQTLSIIQVIYICERMWRCLFLFLYRFYWIFFGLQNFLCHYRFIL